MNKKATRIIFLTLTLLLLPITSFSGWVQANPNPEETRGTVLYVSSGGSGTCTSWADTCDLQAALTAAIVTDEIWVQSGTYLPTNTTDRTISFVLKNGVAIYGGFAGTETARDQRNWTGNLTILSGDIGNPAIITDNTYNVVYGYQLDATAILDGFTVTSGNANGSGSPSNSGGGMYNNEISSPTLTNLIFSSNSAVRGGGMYNLHLSNPTMTNVSFSSNTASEYGGGIYNSAGCIPTLIHASFSNNSANYGGGMYNSSSSPTMTNVTFSGNTASFQGGGISNTSYSYPTLTNVTLTGNTAVEDGGGMFNSYSNPTLANVTFSSNSTSLKGGGMYNSYSSPTMVNGTFSGNTAATDGGGIFNRSSSNPTLTNVTFAGNTASSGSGGGLYNSTSCTTTVTNAIFWGNSPNQVFRASGTIVIKFSDIQGSYTGEGNINLDPLLGPLADNGGFTLTNMLHPDSPAIDTGSPTVCPATDQRGYVRPVDGDGNGSSICDMGAIEFGSEEAHGPVLYVSSGGSGTCTSWADTCNLQDALTTAIAPDEIWVEAGTYLPTETADRTISFLLKDGVAIYGGFAGTETAVDQRDLTGNPTILSGDIGTPGDSSDNSYHVVYGTALSATTILDSFTITAGNADGNEPYSTGGGMFNYTNSSPTVTNVTFSNNSAISGGGISNTSNSNPTVTNVTFSNNSAISGGGISNTSNSNPALTNVTFSNNSANFGGGTYNNNSSPTLTNVTFSGNTASNYGGGISNTTNSSPTLINVILWGNLPDQVHNDSSTPVITYSDIQGGYTGEGNINLDPLLGPLADNGGFTLTHMLLPGSPAIDTGSPSVCPATDQRGYVRPIDGDGNGSSKCDMGAIEAHQIIFVDEDSLGLNNGTSWSNAFTDLQDALEIANSEDQIWVADGMYLPIGTTDRTISFELKNGVAIYGGFAGKETALKQRDFVSNLTILSGDIGVTGNTSDNSYHVVYGLQVDATAILDGFNIISGNGNGSNPPDDLGGGMYNAFDSSPTLANLTFSNNSARGGGGIYNYIDSSPMLTNITFLNNSASYGGGMFNHSANPSLTNVTFSFNSTSIEGGGIFNYDSSPSLTNVTFSNNPAEYGGGMSNYNNSSPTLINVTFSNNSATLGGGIYNATNSNPTLTNVILWSNSIGQVFNDGTSNPDITCSDIQGGYIGTGNIDQDPLLDPLADNGGFTLTHALGAGSPAIDTGSHSICPATDQRGYGRPIDGDLNGSLICDMGAYEYDPFTYIFLPLIIR